MTEQQTAEKMVATVIDAATDIMMDKFITIMVDGRLELLCVEGVASAAQLQGAWSKIVDEYTEALGDESQGELLSILRDIHILSWQQQRVMIFTEVLSVYYFPEAAAELRRMGYRLRYDPDRIQDYLQDLKNAVAKAGTLGIRIGIRRKDLEAYYAKKSGKDATRADFQSMLITLSINFKYQVDPRKISCYQFATMMRSSREQAKEIEKRMAKQKGGGRGN